MTPTWFNTTERMAALKAEAKRWERTPFFPNSEACGTDGGADCVRLLHGIYTALGVMPRILIPKQVMDEGQHSERSRLIEFFDQHPVLCGRFVKLRPSDEPLPGDTLCFLAGKVPHHGGMMVTSRDFIHTLRPAGAHMLQLGAAVRGWRIIGKLAAIYRPIP